MKKIIKYLLHPKKVILYLMNKGWFKFIPDKTYLKWKYKLVMDKKLNLDNPHTFNEKIQWLKLYDRKDIYATMVDKYEAKNYVGKIIGDKYIIKTYGVYNSFNEIDFTKLPNQFVIKPTHTSGDVFICKNKNEIDYKLLEKKINKWLKRDYYCIHREWPYKNVKPRIIIEEYLNELSDKSINDYKFFMFNNNLKYYIICSDRNKNLKVTFFDENDKFIDVCQDGDDYDINVNKPINIKLMKSLAKKLSVGLSVIRVDFYEVNNKVYFGELTLYDSAGYGKFEPEKYDKIFGDYITLKK